MSMYSVVPTVILFEMKAMSFWDHMLSLVYKSAQATLQEIQLYLL